MRAWESCCHGRGFGAAGVGAAGAAREDVRGRRARVRVGRRQSFRDRDQRAGQERCRGPAQGWRHPRHSCPEAQAHFGYALGYALDNEEALGYFLGDLVDHPLEENGARSVSKRASRHVKVIKTALHEVASTARKAAKKAGTSPDEAAEAARAAYLREPFDLT